MTKLKISLLLLLFLSSGAVIKVKAQSKTNSCRPTVEEILFAINPVKDWNPDIDGVLAAGEFKSNTGIKIDKENPLSVSQLIAMVGGIPLAFRNQPIYLIRQPIDKAKDGIQIDWNAIKKGQAEDIRLEKGDILFIPRGCENGKLLSPTKSIFQEKVPKGVDAPINLRSRILY